jgi:hypothetical protein
MVAVRDILSSLNSLAQSGLLASGWLRQPQELAVADDAGVRESGPEPDEGPYTQGGVDPPLDELLDDPIIGLMMRADHLEPEQVRRLLKPESGQGQP